MDFPPCPGVLVDRYIGNRYHAIGIYPSIETYTPFVKWLSLLRRLPHREE